jgi:hypothetical protein
MDLFMLNITKTKTLAVFLGASFCAVAGHLGFTRKWLTTWGAASDEHTRPLAGDDLIPGGVHARVNMTQAVTIDATPEKVWPWLAQIGQDRAGFMSFEKLERLLGFGIYNTYRIVPQWQLKAGDFCRFHKSGVGMRVVEAASNKHLVMVTDSKKRAELEPGQIELLPPVSWKWHLAWNWSFNLIALPDGKTRFLARGLAYWDPINPVVDFILDLMAGVPSSIMQMQMLRELKQLSEGTHPSQ